MAPRIWEITLTIMTSAPITMTPAEIAVLSRLCGRLLARGYACEPTYVAYLRAPEERRIDAAASQAMQA